MYYTVRRSYALLSIMKRDGTVGISQRPLSTKTLKDNIERLQIHKNMCCSAVYFV